MLKVGITGGIGSGKSTVARMFTLLGVPVYNADDAAKSLMNTDPGIKAALVAEFGPQTYTAAGLNRVFLAETVFGNAAALTMLNSIVHPAVVAHAVQWMAQQQGPYALKEAALMFESGSQADLDVVIGVYAPESLRIARAMNRDGASRETVVSRLSKQLDESIKMKLCDLVIANTDRELVIPQVLYIHQLLLQKADAAKSPAAG
ncbi:MAG: dephospho-CoA kinase [Bacteroidetes bacterium]|nr:MAG: dephospho-CoA kinase [Bacteroidota bacterium]